jgi:hypothetical protein
MDTIKLPNTQDYLKFTHGYTVDPADTVTSAVCKYIKPDGTEGSWTAVVDGVNKKVTATIPKGEPLSMTKIWFCWFVLTMTDGRILPCKRFTIEVVEEKDFG